MIHGTSGIGAWGICKLGMMETIQTNKKNPDWGWYGRGLYLTSVADYAEKYTKDGGAFVVCYTIPAKVYPVVEGPGAPGNFNGQQAVDGFQSHFTIGEPHFRTFEFPFLTECPPHHLVDRPEYNSGNQYLPVKNAKYDKTKVADELVVFDAFQILPAFIVFPK